MKITRKELIESYLLFFKLRKHAILNNSSLIPENDPTCLFTTAGMHPLVPYLQGQKHPMGKRLVSVQKCVRTGDIDEVGDATHHTFFEMLGNWSLDDYWKFDSIKMSFEFLTQVLKIPIGKLSVSCFKGDKNSKKDEESAKIWEDFGINKDKIIFLGKEDNWWGPAGKTGPCGPDTEIYYYINSDNPKKDSNPENNEKDWFEIWNNVFMQYNKTESGFEEAKQRNVDTGMGVERTLTVLNGLKDNYQTEIFVKGIDLIETLSNKRYGLSNEHTKFIRIILDHIRASVFILSEGIQPSNLDQGYVLRRLIRRSIRFAKKLGIEVNFCKKVAETFIDYYEDYPELKNKKQFILGEIEIEEKKFKEKLQEGLKEFEKMKRQKQISGKDAFVLYTTYGFPIELTQELAKESGQEINMGEFEKEMGKHQELSRTATKGKFKSGLADNSELTTKLHTAAHLLNQALREILKQEIHQKGSNITPERLRFDFNFPRKLTEQELKDVENLVNKKIQENLVVIKEEMCLEDARKKGAQGVFTHKYGAKVYVYSICDKNSKNEVFSCEICAGPHVSNLKELGYFKIVKEESVGSGARRIRAVLE